MSRAAVAAELIAYGRELERQGAAQIGSSFTGRPEMDELIETDPNAFLLGMLFTQGIPAERAWAGPWLLRERIGTLAMEYLAAHSDEVREAVQQPPMLHRFKETLPRWIVAAAERITVEYGGDAAKIWPAGDHVLDVTERLAEFDGIGRKKSVMAVEILTRHFGIELEGRQHGQVAYDVHVRRVFLRSGLVARDDRREIEEAAREFSPASPGTLDLPAWLIGRETCRPRVAHCDRCVLGRVCPRLVWLNVEGVGVRKRP